MTQAHVIQIEKEYRCQQTINLYKTPRCKSLVTQAAIGRHFRFFDHQDDAGQSALQIWLCEDDYPGWISLSDLSRTAVTEVAYRPISRSPEYIQQSIPEIVRFALEAMNRPNQYLWGGTIGPNYDCSGLMQAAFASAGIIIPRDSYQQEAFSQPVTLQQLQLGDLLFFGSPERTTHVGLYLSDGQYIHSSGRDNGRNGIGIDSLEDRSDPVSLTYYRQFRRAGRIMHSYHSSLSRNSELVNSG